MYVWKRRYEGVMITDNIIDPYWDVLFIIISMIGILLLLLSGQDELAGIV